MEVIRKSVSVKEDLSERKMLNLALKADLIARRRGITPEWHERLVISLSKLFSQHCNENETVLLSKLNDFLYNR